MSIVSTTISEARTSLGHIIEARRDGTLDDIVAAQRSFRLLFWGDSFQNILRVAPYVVYGHLLVSGDGVPAQTYLQMVNTASAIVELDPATMPDAEYRRELLTRVSAAYTHLGIFDQQITKVRYSELSPP